MILISNSKTYDKLKFLAQIVLPALATFYFTLAGIWGLPAAEQVVGTIVAFDLFLGTILQLSSNAYAKSDARFNGELNVREVGDKTAMQFEFKDDEQVRELPEKKEVVFKVNKEEQDH